VADVILPSGPRTSVRLKKARVSPGEKKKRKKSSLCSKVVVFGIPIQSHQSHVGVISPDRLLPRAWIMSDHRQMQIRVSTIA